jgi:NADH dehydrogenase FAD-containing subunit
MATLSLTRRTPRAALALPTLSSSRFSSSTTTPSPPKHRVLVLGSGWAGYALARTLRPSTHDRAIVSPRSHFVFTPLLASTTVGTLEFRAVLEPVRRLGLDAFHEGYADRVDFSEKKVWLRPFAPAADDAAAAPLPTKDDDIKDTRRESYAVPYDTLVIAVGAYPQTFNTPGVSTHAHLLRTATDARRIRLRLLSLFEHASRPDVSRTLKKKLLHFAVVGGGPTGVEFAAELHDFVHEDLPRLYPDLVPLVSITVYDVAPTVLPMFERDLARYATELFKRQGIKVRTEAMIKEVVKAGHDPSTTTTDVVTTKSKEAAEEKEIGLLTLRIKNGGQTFEEVPAGIVVWSTGLAQNPLLSRLSGVRRDGKTGGLLTDQYLRVLADNDSSKDSKKDTTSKEVEVVPNVYAIGDCAVVTDQRYPATAQVASQQAVYLGRQLNKLSSSSSSSSSSPPEFSKEFHFRNLGTMAYLGNWRAIHQSSADELKGRAAWLLWRTAYLTKSMSVRNKIMVPVYWLMTWIFGRDISRF